MPISRKLTSQHNLEVIKPTVAKEWHPAKNGSLTPADVAPSSNKKAWWLCKKGHEWDAVISSRSRGINCPYCSGEELMRKLI